MGVRAQRRQEIEADILRIARRDLRASGPEALSLRAIARELGMVSSGVYRYVDSREELLTRLIVDTFTQLGEAVTRAHDARDTEDLEGRWDAVGHALRAWALQHPYDFALVYGTPLRGYAAPAERTTAPGTVVISLLVRLVADAHDAGRVVTVPGAEAEEGRAAVDLWLAGDDFFAGIALPAAVVARAVSAWTLLLGTVTAEVFGQYGPIPDPDALFTAQLHTARRLVLAPQQDRD